MPHAAGRDPRATGRCLVPLLLWLLGASPGARAAPRELTLGGEGSGGAALVLTADEIELVDGVVQGRGGVVVSLGEERLWCASFRYDPDSGVLSVHEGRWERASGTAWFDDARIDVEGRSGDVQGTRLVAGDGDLFVQGRALSWQADGRLVGEDLRVTTCGCAHPLWEVSARHVVVIPEESLRFRGGLVRVLGVPLVPLPGGRLPLAERQSGLLPPRLGAGEDGVVVALPAYLTLGDGADLSLEPELRSERGARLLTEARWAQPAGGGRLRAAGGYDWLEAQGRGAIDLTEGLASGPWRLGVDAALESDRSYLSDYGGAFLSRSMPWDETLAVAAWGPLRLEHDGFQALGADSLHGQRPLGLVAALPGRRVGPAAVDLGTRVDLFAEGTDPWRLDDAPVARSETTLSAVTGHELGLVRVEGQAAGTLIGWSDGPTWGTAGAELAGWLPAWSEVGGGRLVGEWGVVGGLGQTLGTVEARVRSDAPPAAWSIGPAVTGRLLTRGGVPVSGAAALAWTDAGWRPAGWLRADQGAWSIRASADLDLQELALGFDDGRLSLTTAGVRAAEVLQQRLAGAWTLPGGLSAWRPGYQALLDLDAGTALSHGPRLSFSSRCDCLSLAASLTWAVDRDTPDLGLSLQLP